MLVLIGNQLLVPHHEQLLIDLDFLADCLIDKLAFRFGVTNVHQFVLQVLLEHDRKQRIIVLSLDALQLGGQ